ncbi:MAG: hypothetical protein HZA95_01415 [Candidatus Vogelbacteria bacterium]|nr:hypothetical protein [Candidatus Vogelbacteria bacterium]
MKFKETIAVLDERGEPTGYVLAVFELEIKLDENQADVVCLSMDAPELGGKRQVLALPCVATGRFMSLLSAAYRTMNR